MGTDDLQEHAVPFDLGVAWDAGAPLPHLLCNGQRTFLIFFLPETTPPTGPDESLALVEFHGATVKFGGPNDEVLHGHPLYGRGLQPYGSHIVVNSLWLRELEAINKVHPRYDPEHWKNKKHYLLSFHDETFECLANGHRVEIHQTSLEKLVQVAVRRMLS